MMNREPDLGSGATSSKDEIHISLLAFRDPHSV